MLKKTLTMPLNRRTFAQAITAAAFEEVDTTPLEGFDADALDEILGLRAKGLRSCVMLPGLQRQ
jgi:hypothetical protein